MVGDRTRKQRVRRDRWTFSTNRTQLTTFFFTNFPKDQNEENLWGTF